MGLFGFGKKKHKASDEDAAAQESDETQAKDADSTEAEDAQAADAAEAPADEAQDAAADEDVAAEADADEAGDIDLTQGPWDYDDEGIDPDDDDRYISFGSMFLPLVEGLTIRAKRSQDPQSPSPLESITVQLGDGAIEIVPFAAPKTLGLWDDMSDELLDANKSAKVQEGRFGDEVMLPVAVKGKTMMTRIVGVDGPRWLLRGIFTGDAADGESDNKKALEDYFAQIIVRRGDAPLAPRDIIPILPPKTAAQRRADAAAAAKAAKKKSEIKDDTDVPQSYDQSHKVQTTLRRGPMFSEMR
ncbi:DUF3710 domain-containing protein [Pseudoscardovia suis]|uniref:DUF3710 domain-containing protein n=1 Tax=Pseudoscardovia suis TaxID=987063 RepID=A0A261F1A4_9BIFI|nr:DUF3710 domain-containing protein [Pseudoscardovia suis]OZG52706.1 hypothetical protein PSSU_0324 [Pseudoscardovia suis]PJJ64881.1 uncharacterized protein DUF3710 [Pseudoscardovia suis]